MKRYLGILAAVLLAVACEKGEETVVLSGEKWNEINRIVRQNNPEFLASYTMLVQLLDENERFQYWTEQVQEHADERLEADRNQEADLQLRIFRANQAVAAALAYDVDNGDRSPLTIYADLQTITGRLHYSSNGEEFNAYYSDLGLPSGTRWYNGNYDVWTVWNDDRSFSDYFNQPAPDPVALFEASAPSVTDLAAFIRQRAQRETWEMPEEEQEAVVRIPYTEFVQKWEQAINSNGYNYYEHADWAVYQSLLLAVEDAMFEEYEAEIARNEQNASDRIAEEEAYVDAFETALGQYYQYLFRYNFQFLAEGELSPWGNGQIGGTGTSFSLSNDIAYTQWGGYARVPTRSEFEELLNYCDWTWINDTLYGLTGWKITGPNGKSIFLPYVYNASARDDGVSHGYMINERFVSSDWTGYIYGYRYYAFDVKNKMITRTQQLGASDSSSPVFHIRPVFNAR